MENQITKYDEVLENFEKGMRAYINSPEKFAEVLTAVKKAEGILEEIKTKVKERGGELMDKQDLKEIEFGDFVVRRIDPSETKEYSSKSVITAFVKKYGVDEGMGMVVQFLKVKGGDLEKWFIKGRVPFDVIEPAKEGLKIKLKKGFIGLYPKKKETDKPIYIKE